MAFQPVSFFESDATGSLETITLQPVDPSVATNATIASAFYGTDNQGSPQPAQVAADSKSLSLKVLQGINPLVITLVSPNSKDETVKLVQDATVLATPTLRQHSGVSTIFIKGA